MPPSREPPHPGRAKPTAGPQRQRPRPPRSPRITVEEVSAGGLVVDRTADPPRVAVIARFNRAGRKEWCLPKGHVESGETSEQAAVREIEEETGIQGRMLTSLGIVDYWFAIEGRRVHKRVHHYLLEATGGTIGVDGDPDQEAIEAAWVPIAEALALLAFPNERRIVRKADTFLAAGT
jgi:8-oxo-dGTP pyrophosphatase MutT (NUDIX family)